MAASKTAEPKKKAIDSKAAIIDAYLDYVLTENKQPKSIYAFCKHLEITEDVFYNHFNSFQQIEEQQWVTFYDETKKILESDEVYGSFSVREKMLSFYFTWIEQLKKKRSFCTYYTSQYKQDLMLGKGMKDFKSVFKTDVKSLIIEGISNEEIAQRTKISDQYDELFWLINLFILRYWLNDTSNKFEKTDAAIEKAVNLAFDLISRGALDSLLDFGKFMLVNKNL
jgi:hypothetical protein